MGYNVLVLAMSTLNGIIINKERFKETTYQLKERGQLVGKTYSGIGQLEAVPQFVRDTSGSELTHVIILATPETQRAVDFGRGPEETYKAIVSLYKDRLDMKDVPCLWTRIPQQMSHLEFFVRRMCHEDIRPDFEVVDIDHENPSAGLGVLLQRIQDLYHACPTNEKTHEKEWNLWLDTHGGFRDVSMAMFALMQVLAAPDEQDFSAYMERDKGLVDRIKRMSDHMSTVPVTGVYSVEFDQSKASKGIPQAILDQTEFYKTFTKPAVQAYMNYGQYVQMYLKSVVDLDVEPVPPYAFISYRREDARLERYAFLGSLKRFGYRYWYDDGIQLQEDWQRKLVEANRKCTVFIAIISKTYYTSDPCVQELKQAIAEGKLVILVSPDGTPLYADDRDVRTQEGTVIAKEQLAEIVRHQQFDMTTHTIDDVFQEFAVKERLAWLSEHDERFRSIRIDEG